MARHALAVAGGLACLVPAALALGHPAPPPLRPAPLITIAGNGATCTTAPVCGDGHAATQAGLNAPYALALDGAGNLIVADAADDEVRRVSPSGTITRVAGSGIACAAPPACGDGGRATTAPLDFPAGVAVDRAGDIFIADAGDGEVREVSPNGRIRTVAGDGIACTTAPACGDGGPATKAELNSPAGLALDGTGNLYIADYQDNEVRRVSPAGTIATVAGNGAACVSPPACGDGARATSAEVTLPQGLALSAGGSIYISDYGDNEVRRVSPAGVISTIAGNGAACLTLPHCGDGGPARSARLDVPGGLALDPAGDVYIADSGDNEVRRVSSSGRISTVAARLDTPGAITLDSAGNLFIADTLHDEIRLLAGPRAAVARGHGLVLAALAASYVHGRVTVRCALSKRAQLALALGTALTRKAAVAGLAQLRLARRLRAGRYRLRVSAKTPAGIVALALPLTIRGG